MSIDGSRYRCASFSKAEPILSREIECDARQSDRIVCRVPGCSMVALPSKERNRETRVVCPDTLGGTTCTVCTADLLHTALSAR